MLKLMSEKVFDDTCGCVYTKDAFYNSFKKIFESVTNGE